MQRTDVNRPKEQLHAPTLQDMLDMDSEMDGGKIYRDMVPEDDMEMICIFLILISLVLPAINSNDSITNLNHQKADLNYDFKPLSYRFLNFMRITRRNTINIRE